MIVCSRPAGLVGGQEDGCGAMEPGAHRPRHLEDCGRVVRQAGHCSRYLVRRIVNCLKDLVAQWSSTPITPANDTPK